MWHLQENLVREEGQEEEEGEEKEEEKKEGDKKKGVDDQATLRSVTVHERGFYVILQLSTSRVCGYVGKQIPLFIVDAMWSWTNCQR